MKPLFTKVMWCAAALLITLNVKAQDKPDYVITMKGDSISCHISFGIFNNAKYTATGTTNSVKIKPEEVKEYHVTRSNTTYASVTVEGDISPRFLEVLEKGKLILYIYSNTTSGAVPTAGGGMMMTGPMNHSQWYISKNGGLAKVLKGTGIMVSGGSRKQRKADFGEMLKDNNLVYQKYIKDDKFDIDQIQNLVHWYNTGQQLPEPPPDNHLDY